MMKSVLTHSADRPPVRQTNATKGVWAFGIAAIFAGASPAAFAADVPIRGPGPVPPYMTPNPCYNCNYYYNWTGFYIGATVGAAWERSTLTDNFFNVSFNNDRSGFIAGGQIGYNWQLSPQFVVGVEWMFDGTDLKSDTTTVVGAAVIRTSSKVDWITSLAARFGWAANNWLWYGKVGGAWVHDSTTLTATIPGIVAVRVVLSCTQAPPTLPYHSQLFAAQPKRAAREVIQSTFELVLMTAAPTTVVVSDLRSVPSNIHSTPTTNCGESCQL